MSKIVHVDDNNFEAEVTKSDRPVLVDFSATWCGPCQRQTPILEKFATENEAVKVVKIDIDDAPAITSKLGIRGVPSLLFFKEGKKVDSKIGLTSLADINVLVTKTS